MYTYMHIKTEQNISTNINKCQNLLNLSSQTDSLRVFNEMLAPATIVEPKQAGT